jgi:hypothetical protein
MVGCGWLWGNKILNAEGKRGMSRDLPVPTCLTLALHLKERNVREINRG